MDTKTETAPVCTAKPRYQTFCLSPATKKIAIEFPVTDEIDLSYVTEDGTLPDADNDEMWVEQGDMIDAYVVVDRYGHRVSGEPIWATVGEYDLLDNTYLQKAIDAALAQDQDDEIEDQDGPWGHGPWVQAQPKPWTGPAPHH